MIADAPASRTELRNAARSQLNAATRMQASPEAALSAPPAAAHTLLMVADSLEEIIDILRASGLDAPEKIAQIPRGTPPPPGCDDAAIP